MRSMLSLAPRQHSTGGKQRLGSISKMGERTIRRLQITGGSSVVHIPRCGPDSYRCDGVPERRSLLILCP